MLATLIGTAARAAVTGAVGVAVIGVFKDAKVGDTLRTVAVTVTEAGVRGYKLVESGVEKVAETATDIYKEAAQRAEEPLDVTDVTDADVTDVADAAAGEAAAGGSVASEAESFLRENGTNETN